MIRKEVYVKLILCLCLLLQSVVADFQLELVQVIFRHGDRTPSSTELFPKAPLLPIYETLGNGQLTEAGKMREYHLGTLLKQKYNTLLGNSPRYSDVNARSTDFQRTKMSVQLVLKGLYPSTDTTSNQMDWSAVPIVNLPIIVDSLMFLTACPTYQNELKKVKNSTIVRIKLSKYKDLFDYLQENTGSDMTSDPIIGTSKIYQYLASQKGMNITLPQWATANVQKRIEEIVALDYELQSATIKMKRLSGGAFVKQLIENMNFKGNTTAPKIYLYGGHEINIASVSKAHGLTEPKIPQYGSAIIVEKLRNDSGKEFVQMFLWTGVTGNLIAYTLPKCTTLCPYDTYIRIVKNIIPTNEELDCLWNNVTKDQLRQYYSRNQIGLK
ncbi:PREDICTED: venom acid phosphatase Acph-1-like [Habropoda laboriosa]|uniref:venom acid phosphatase Acph-1-like n=1 Tax=Habropoda laboriosa TaxID=597456 RepID=UPI00083D4ED4|nr:PREDICTED: venom acid phosphatase Acph-1-like [Habropoda laboriosa]